MRRRWFLPALGIGACVALVLVVLRERGDTTSTEPLQRRDAGEPAPPPLLEGAGREGEGGASSEASGRGTAPHARFPVGGFDGRKLEVHIRLTTWRKGPEEVPAVGVPVAVGLRSNGRRVATVAEAVTGADGAWNWGPGDVPSVDGPEAHDARVALFLGGDGWVVEPDFDGRLGGVVEIEPEQYPTTWAVEPRLIVNARSLAASYFQVSHRGDVVVIEGQDSIDHPIPLDVEVTSSTGEPVSHAWVSGSDLFRSSERTAEAGLFRLYFREEGKHVIEASVGSPKYSILAMVDVRPQMPVARVRMVFDAANCARGVLRFADGRPAPSVLLVLTPAAEDLVSRLEEERRSTTLFMRDYQLCVSDEEGHYSFVGLEPEGSYRLWCLSDLGVPEILLPRVVAGSTAGTATFQGHRMRVRLEDAVSGRALHGNIEVKRDVTERMSQSVPLYQAGIGDEGYVCRAGEELSITAWARGFQNEFEFHTVPDAPSSESVVLRLTPVGADPVHVRFMGADGKEVDPIPFLVTETFNQMPIDAHFRRDGSGVVTHDLGGGIFVIKSRPEVGDGVGEWRFVLPFSKLIFSPTLEPVQVPIVQGGILRFHLRWGTGGSWEEECDLEILDADGAVKQGFRCLREKGEGPFVSRALAEGTYLVRLRSEGMTVAQQWVRFTGGHVTEAELKVRD